MQNIQYRVIDAPAATLGTLMDGTAGPEDRLWPSETWPPMVLDNGLAVGSRGGHGPIRYRVTAHEPGRRVRFAFEPGLGIRGYHEMRITDEGTDRSRLTHTLSGTTSGRMLLLWPLVVRWLHEALLRELFDNAELAATGRLAGPPARPSRWVRLLRTLYARATGTRLKPTPAAAPPARR